MIMLAFNISEKNPVMHELLDVRHVYVEDQGTDLLKKPLINHKFQELRNKLLVLPRIEFERG